VKQSLSSIWNINAQRTATGRWEIRILPPDESLYGTEYFEMARMYCARSKALGAGQFSGSAALELRDGFIFMLFHPGNEIFFNDADLPDAVPDERGAEHGHVGASHEHFQNVGRAMDAAGGRQTAFETAVKDGNPAQWKRMAMACSTKCWV